jgi:hypothetical protein
MVSIACVITSLMLIAFHFFIYSFSDIYADNTLVITGFTIIVIGNLIQTVVLIKYFKEGTGKSNKSETDL